MASSGRGPKGMSPERTSWATGVVVGTGAVMGTTAGAGMGVGVSA